MPRGVPKNGVRRPRSVPVAAQEANDDAATVAVGTLYGAVPDPVAAPVEETPPAAELTPDQQEIKRLRDQLAREKGRKDVEPEFESEVGDGDSIVIHFLEDGLTVNGVVKYRGDEQEFPLNGGAYRDTFDRNGRTWLDLRGDDFAQVERWGKVMFRAGPWPGKSYADGRWETLRNERGDGFLSPPSPEEIEAAEKARRNRQAPRIPQQV